MSLTTEITALTSQVSDLASRVDGWVSDADARLAAAIAAVPNMARTVYVDQVNGNDAADGHAETAAVATISRALQLVGPMMWGSIVLMGDVDFTGSPQIIGSKIHVRALDPAAPPTVSCGTDLTIIMWNSFWRWESLRLLLPAGATGSQKIFWPAGFAAITFRECTVEYPGTGDVYLSARGYGGLVLSGYGITSINMAGHWVQEAPAGTEIDAVPGVISSIANV